jgi:L-histidine N-alpha-methyltransferase
MTAEDGPLSAGGRMTGGGMAEAAEAASGRAAGLDEDFAEAVLAGLAASPKWLLSKHLYDAEGSRLFDRITGLEEYYPTRTEIAILRGQAGRLAALLPEGGAIVEPGAGSGTKLRILLDALPGLAACVPVDISGDHLASTAAALRRDYPHLAVHAVTADFARGFRLPEAVAGMPLAIFFPGSTIGNFTREAAIALLARFRALPGAVALVIGVDLVKDRARLLRAYDDREGVTAAFNLNLLARINRELGGDFDLGAFAHEARWNEAESRIEMHLRSLRAQQVRVAGRTFAFAPEETIHTESSHKYTVEGFRALAAAAGWQPRDLWLDPDGLFSVHVLAADGLGSVPGSA